MKIHDNDPILNQLNPESQIKRQPSDDQEFGNILKERVDHSTHEVAGAQQTAFVNPLHGVRMNISPEIEPYEALDRTENLIGLLDQYRQQLANPAVTLKQIDPMIQEIGREAQNLTPLLNILPKSEELKNIINETLVMASTEVTKFYRGDYT